MKWQPEEDASLPDTPDRPLIITLVCLWWFIVAPISGLLAAVEIGRVLSAPGASGVLRMQYLALALYTLVLGLGVVCMIGLWRMKKWSVIAFAGLFVLSQLIAAFGNSWSVGGFLAWLIALVVGIGYYSRMK